MATIYCFTSTGNSLYAAKKIAEEIGGTVRPMRAGDATCEDDVIGFVFPNYFWGLPRIVTRFVSELRIARKDAYVFAVVTCGGTAFGVIGLLKKLLKSKGVSLQYGAGLLFISNYIPEFKINYSEARHRKTEHNLNRIIGELKRRETNRIPAFTAINELAYRFYPDQNSDRHFSVSSKCTGCGMCQKVCPVDNIVMENSKPCFRHKCEHCLGCLHNCPAAAIDWKQKTQGKKRYRHSKIGLDDLISLNR